MTALVFALAIATGWFAAEFCCAGLRPRWAARLLQLALAVGGGIGIASSAYFLLLLLGGATSLGVAAIDASLAAVAASLVWRRRQRAAAEASPAPAFRWNWILALLLGVGLVLASAAFSDALAGVPEGQWDAWALWNAQARFLAGPGATWHNGFDPVSFPHADYPLLLPGFIASAWKCAGDIDPAVPPAVALLFAGAVVALLVSTLAILRSLSLALLAGIVLLSGVGYLMQVPTLYADVPLSFYCLAALALLLLSALPGLADPRPLLIAAGLSAGFAAWTKNEGVMMAGILLLCSLVALWAGGGLKPALLRWPWILAGVMPGLSLHAGFRLLLALASDPYLHLRPARALAMLGDGTRYTLIGKAFLDEFLGFGVGILHPLLLIAILALVLRFRLDPHLRTPLACGVASLALIFAGYWLAYLLTPSDLRWHLQTSANRLLAQIWPAFVLLVFLVLKKPEDTART